MHASFERVDGDAANVTPSMRVQPSTQQKKPGGFHRPAFL